MFKSYFYTKKVTKIDFDLSTPQRAQQLKEFLQNSKEIIFSVVSEPPAEQPNEPCIDLCNAYWDLTLPLQKEVLSLDLISEEGITVGRLEIVYQGLDNVLSEMS